MYNQCGLMLVREYKFVAYSSTRHQATPTNTHLITIPNMHAMSLLHHITAHHFMQATLYTTFASFKPHTLLYWTTYTHTTQHTIPSSCSTNSPSTTFFSPSPFSSESHLDRFHVAFGVEVESWVDCQHDTTREEEGYTRGHDGVHFA